MTKPKINRGRPRAGWTAAAVVALALAGCHDGNGNDDDNGPPNNTGITSVPDLAVEQINTKTCNTRQPDEINNLSISTSNETIDVATLTPACSSGTRYCE